MTRARRRRRRHCARSGEESRTASRKRGLNGFQNRKFPLHPQPASDIAHYDAGLPARAAWHCRSVLVFRLGNLFQIALGCASAVAAEALVLKLRKMAVSRILADNSALLTGLLLAISIPPFAPWWMVVLGTVFAVIIAKQLYGGLGHNPFNPAMIGYVVLLISFPVQMTSWLPPHEIAATVPGFMDALHVIFTGHTALGADMNALRMGVDGISQRRLSIPLKRPCMPGTALIRS